jgi:hypothetical protein
MPRSKAEIQALAARIVAIGMLQYPVVDRGLFQVSRHARGGPVILCQRRDRSPVRRAEKMMKLIKPPIKVTHCHIQNGTPNL